MSYFNIVCDACGRGVQGITWVNGMKFCAKCYQETFNNKMVFTNETGKFVDLLNNEMYELKISNLEYKLEEKDQRIEELEEQLKNAIVPKFKVGQDIWEITPLMSWKIKRIEWHKFNGGNGDVVIEIYRLGHDGNDDYNCCIMPDDNDRFFATKEEAQAKLEELKGK